MSNILLITSSGGGGLLQAAIAIEQEERKKKFNCRLIKRDVLMDWTKFGIGLFFKNFYNFTQITGNVKIQNFLVNLNIIANFVLYPFLFFGTLYNLYKYDIQRVIDNQPMAPAAVIAAIRLYNKIAKKEIILEKVLVDLPTKRYAQFLKSIKNLSGKNKRYIKIISAEPLLEKDQTDEEFWEKYCSLSKEKILYKYFIREGFKKYEKSHKPKGEFIVSLRTSCAEEKELIKKCLEKSKGNFKNTKEGFDFSISSKDKLIVILLGSQPSSLGTYSYVQSFLDVLREKKEKYYIFVFCKKFSLSKKMLFYKIDKLIEKKNPYPENVNIIPMSFQKEDVIAALFYRSDMTITRSGGQTIMELIKIAQGKKFIHSEKNLSEKSFEKLLEGIPFWEAGNACYLCEKNKGNLINSRILKEYV